LRAEGIGAARERSVVCIANMLQRIIRHVSPWSPPADSEDDEMEVDPSKVQEPGTTDVKRADIIEIGSLTEQQIRDVVAGKYRVVLMRQ
jgi:hypothetical protein